MSGQPVEREQRVTPLELFFDLVVVFAFTQVTQLMADDLTWRGLGHGLLVLAAIWWAWVGFAWLTNALEPEEGRVRAGMFGAMAAMLVVAFAVPGAFGANAVLFAVAYAIVRLLNLLLYVIAGRRDPGFRRAVAPTRAGRRDRSGAAPRRGMDARTVAGGALGRGARGRSTGAL